MTTEHDESAGPQGPRVHHAHRAGRARRGGPPGLRELFDPRRIRRAMVRKGVRAVILAVLLDKPMHGYQVIQELEARSGGRWRPSAGSVYPTLQQLEDEGLVRGEEQDGRKVYTLTDAGRTEAEESPLQRHPWFNHGADHDGGDSVDLRRLGNQVIGAAVQVSRVGSEAAQAQAREILADTRRRLYRLLADDDAAPDAASKDEQTAEAAEEGASA
jgi:DNA-binding PadR family transcriptional regulator